MSLYIVHMYLQKTWGYNYIIWREWHLVSMGERKSKTQ